MASGPAELLARVIAVTEEGPEDEVLTLLHDDGATATLTRRGLLAAASRAEEHLAREVQVEPGATIILSLPTSVAFVGYFLAALAVGARPAAAPPPERREHRRAAAAQRLRTMADLVRPQAVVAAGAAAVADSIPGVPVFEPLDEATLTAAGGRSLVPSAPSAGVLQLTSGSTARPRACLLADGAVLNSLDAMREATGLARDSRYVGWAPLHHDMGLFGCVLLPLTGRHGTLTLMTPTRLLFDPLGWLRLVSDVRAATTSATPAVLSICVKAARHKDATDPTWRVGLDLSTCSAFAVGAETITPRSLDDFHRAFAENGFERRFLMTTWGLAENTLLATMGTRAGPVTRQVDAARLEQLEWVPGVEGERSKTLVSAGRPLTGVEVAVHDADGHDQGEDAIGELVVRSTSLMDGYLGDEEATAAVLTGSGWLRTGDLGCVSEGEVYVVGRVKEIVIVAGRNFSPVEIEEAVEAVDGVREGGSIAFSIYDEAASTERLVVYVEVEAPDDAVQRGVANAARGVTGHRPAAVVLVAPGSLPRTTSAKRRRALLRQQHLDGTVATRA